jgi:hypothetical protein
MALPEQVPEQTIDDSLSQADGHIERINTETMPAFDDPDEEDDEEEDED